MSETTPKVTFPGIFIYSLILSSEHGQRKGRQGKRNKFRNQTLGWKNGGKPEIKAKYWEKNKELLKYWQK